MQYKDGFLVSGGHIVSFQGHQGYRYVMIKGKYKREHRLIWELFNGPIPEGMVVDHINGIRHDNRIENLRMCTVQQNTMHRVKLNQNNKSGACGVSWRKDRNRWKATINLNRKQIYLGIYETKEEAIKARKAAENKYFGEFATAIGE